MQFDDSKKITIKAASIIMAVIAIVIIGGLIMLYPPSSSNQFVIKSIDGVEYDSIEAFQEGLARVSKDDKFGFINTSGDIVIPIEYEVIFNYQSSGSTVWTWLRKDGNEGLLDSTGNYIIPPIYDSLFGDSPANFCEGVIPVQKDGKWGYVDTNGYEVIPPKLDYDTVGAFYGNLSQSPWKLK